MHTANCHYRKKQALTDTIDSKKDSMDWPTIHKLTGQD